MYYPFQQPFIRNLLFRHFSFFFMTLVFFSASAQALEKSWLTDVDHFIQKGQYAAAVQTIDAISKDISATSADYIKAQILKANTLKSMGRNKLAQSILDPLLPMIEKDCSPELSVRYYNILGNLLVSFSQPEKASDNYKKALTAAKHSENLLLVCEVLNEIGLLHYIYSDQPGYTIKAIETFEQAIKYSESIQKVTKDHHWFHAQLLINLARTFMTPLFHIQKSERIKRIDKAFQYVSDFPNTYKKASQLLSIAALYEQTAQNDKKSFDKYIKRAYQVYHRISDMNQTINDDRLTSRVSFRLGTLYEQTNQIDDAISLTQKSIFYAQKIQAAHLLYEAHWQLGRLYKTKGKPAIAIAQYEKAIDILSPIRQQIYNSDVTSKNVFDRKIKPVYLELAEIFFEKASAQTQPEKYDASIRQAWKTMDKVKMAELEDIFHDECVSNKKENYLELGHTLGPVAVIYVIPFKTQPGLMISLPDGFKSFRLNVDTPTLNKTITQLREAIRQFEDFESHASQLYNWIIAPIYTELKRQKIETLAIASDGALRLLPFSVFLTPDETFLIEEFEIVTIPALHLTRTASTNRESPNILLCGISNERVIGKIFFSALPRVVKELEEIQKIVPGEILLNEAFSPSSIANVLPQKKYTIIHMATHGEFGGIPEKTFLLTHDQRLTMNSLENLFKQSSTSVDLLTLSACQTALGDERAAFGLAGVAVKAGANCAIATLWSVDDYASQKIITAFYRNAYNEKMSKAKALQQAQISLIEKGQFWQPSFWAAFLLIGNWY